MGTDRAGAVPFFHSGHLLSAALVLTSTESARARRVAVVELPGIGHAEERMALADKPNLHELVGAKHAVHQSFSEAGISIDDVDPAEVHDCFSIAQLLCTEALGLSDDGCAGRDYVNGRFARGYECPVNLSGGLKPKGHPVGATGASMHVHVYKQLIGAPLGLGHEGEPEIGVTLNVGGSGGYQLRVRASQNSLTNRWRLPCTSEITSLGAACIRRTRPR